jgi:hypothetical protein
MDDRGQPVMVAEAQLASQSSRLDLSAAGYAAANAL